MLSMFYKIYSDSILLFSCVLRVHNYLPRDIGRGQNAKADASRFRRHFVAQPRTDEWRATNCDCD